MKKDKKVKLVGGVLVATLALSSLVGCSSSKQVEVPDTNMAFVDFVGDNAVVFLASEGYNGIIERSLFGVRSNPYIINENTDQEIYITGDICSLIYVDKEDLENQLRAFVGEDGTITYYSDYDDEVINTFGRR